MRQLRNDERRAGARDVAVEMLHSTPSILKRQTLQTMRFGNVGASPPTRMAELPLRVRQREGNPERNLPLEAISVWVRPMDQRHMLGVSESNPRIEATWHSFK